MSKYFFGWVDGWMGGWLEKWGLKLTSAEVEVEVEAELGKNFPYKCFFSKISYTLYQNHKHLMVIQGVPKNIIHFMFFLISPL